MVKGDGDEERHGDRRVRTKSSRKAGTRFPGKVRTRSPGKANEELREGATDDFIKDSNDFREGANAELVAV